MKRSKISLCLLAVVELLGVAYRTQAQASAPTYNIIDLGTLGGNSSQAYGINNLGQVCGYSYRADGRSHPFLYTNNTMLDLGSIDPTASAQNDNGTAAALNDSGQVVGGGHLKTGDSRGFLYIDGTLRVLPLLAASGVNKSGQIVGRNSQLHAASYANSTTTDLGTLGNGAQYSQATDINNQGQIVGYSGIDAIGTTNHAFLYQNGTMQDLGILPGKTDSEADAISDNGIIVGTVSNRFNASLAVYWQDGQIYSLGTLGGPESSAFAINKYNVIVGVSDLPGNRTTAFVYQNGQMYDVFAGTDWSFGIAEGINDSGQIVGVGVSPSGYFRAFLATPIAPQTVTLSGVIVLEGLVPDAPAQSVTLELRPGNGSPKIVQTVSVGPDGSYSVSGLPRQVYTLSVKGAKWLRQTLPAVNADGGNASGINLTLPAGDANDDNRVDIGDFGVLVNAYGSDSSDPTSGYDIRADFACSGQVDVQSFGLLVNNYSAVGDL